MAEGAEERRGAAGAPAPVRGILGLDALAVRTALLALADFAFIGLLGIAIGAENLESAERVGPGVEAEGLRPAELVQVVAWIFILAAILSTPFAARLADSFSKRSVLLGCAAAQTAVSACVLAAFIYGNLPILWLPLALVAVRNALEASVRQALIAERSPAPRLAQANVSDWLGWAAGACSGIIAAQVLAGIAGPARASALLVLVSAAAVQASFQLPAGAPPAPAARNTFREGLRALGARRALRRSGEGIFFFTIVAVLFILEMVPYGLTQLHVGPRGLAFLLIAATAGFGLGIWLAGSFSTGKIELGLVPLGALGVALFSGLLFWTPRVPLVAFEATAGCVALLGVSGGVFLLPVLSLVQRESPAAVRGSVLAAMGLVGALGGVTAFVLRWLGENIFRFAPDQVFLLTGAAMAAVTIYVLTLLPEHLLRFLFWLATNVAYRLRIVGGENVPLEGPALLVSNHVSFVDGLIVLASTPRFIRFIVHKDIADLQAFRRLSKVMRAIPISSEDPPRAVVSALKEAGKALESGELVCIFAEGQISRTGQLQPFRGGMEKILKHHPAPIIPVHLDQVWGSIFSFAGGKFFWKLPRGLPYSVTVSFGKPLSPDTPIDQVRQAVQDLEAEAFRLRKEGERPLPWTFIRKAKRHPFRLAAVDTLGRKASGAKLAAAAVSLAKILGRVWKDQDMAGILLPPSVAGCAVNLAASLLGKPTVNLNYTSAADAVRSALEQCRIRKVVSSRAFLEKVQMTVPAEVVYLEDLAGTRGRIGKLCDALSAWFLPRALLERYIGARKIGVDDVVTVIFSSGSTGEPKGVMQTHFNIISNIQSVSQVLDVGPHQSILGILPFFHSTGYTGGLWAPLVTGMRVVYHPNPLDAKVVGEVAKRHGATILFATPTFIHNYAKRCDPGDFGSLRYAIVGAEKLTMAVAEAFRGHFGIQPMEGYGCTEAAPMISLNIPDHRERGMFQMGWRKGTVGRPLPGVGVRIVDIETGERLPPGKEGMLLVKGPNVMLGYYGKPELTAEVLRDGWYTTGDVAFVDDDGFITITDRLSRFAKIAGEMIPLIRVEETLHQALGLTDQVLTVVTMPDEKKGERLVVVHTLPDEKLDELFEKLPRYNLPNLWVPRRESFIRIAEIPRLATGKVDLKKVSEAAQAAAEVEATR